MNEPSLIIDKIDNQALIFKAHSFPNSGILRREGYYYFLKIEDNFINMLYPMLQHDGSIRKPDYFSTKKPVGAHITVAYAEEAIIFEEGEIGKVHYFTVNKLCSVILGDKQYFVLMIESCSLNILRDQYSLPLKPRFKGVRINFHVTIGVRSLSEMLFN